MILHGIDTETFSPATDRVALRVRLGLPMQGVLVGCYGRIRAQKGTDAFVDAMLRILPDRPEGYALVMGRATEGHQAFLDGLRQRTHNAGLGNRILFLPEVTVDAMPDWYRALDIYVAPQRWEGFGLTPLEAMACAVPAVAARVGAFEDLIVPGQTGELVDPGDIPALAEATARLIDDTALRHSMASAARARACAGFRIEDEAAALTAVYRALLAPPP